MEPKGDSEPLRAMSLREVGRRLGMDRNRVMHIERRALAKVRCALALEEVLGGEAEALLERLRGRPTRDYEAAVRNVKALRVATAPAALCSPEQPHTNFSKSPNRREIFNFSSRSAAAAKQMPSGDLQRLPDDLGKRQEAS